MNVKQSLNKTYISIHLLLVYIGVFAYTLSKHISIMDLSFQESLGSIPKILSIFGCAVLLLSIVLFDSTIKKKTIIVTSGALVVIIANLLPTGYRELLYIFIISLSWLSFTGLYKQCQIIRYIKDNANKYQIL